MRSVALIVVMVLVLCEPLSAAEGENIVYSALFPGWGQMREGRYGRGTFLMGAEIAALAGVLIANIQYDRNVEQYDKAKVSFENATYIGDAEYYHDVMIDKWDSADRMDTYRKTLLGAAVGIWALSLIDMVWGGDPKEIPISMELHSDRFLITKTFSF